MKYDRKKESDPLKTVERARSILSAQGIFTTEIWKNNANDARSYSLQLTAPELGVSTNGKGVTRRYALASAYGEFMERLQNMILLPVEKFPAEDTASGGFCYFPDEELSSAREIADATDALSESVFREFYKGQFLLDIEKDKRLNVIRAYLGSMKNADPEKQITWPFYSVKNHKTVNIWQRFVAYLQGSNGMCAGNTPEEAIVQGMSEIFERYANQEIMISDIVPPDIPENEYRQYDDISAIIDEIEAMGDFSISFKDCSLGRGLPVCAAVLIDRTHQKYRISFGAHPIFAIAAERCLTEVLQGFDPANEKDAARSMVSVKTADILPSLNVHNQQANGRGRFPRSFFYGEPSYEHKPFPDRSGLNNKALFDYCMELALSLSDDVLIRDVSYLGFPAFYIVVPGVSYLPADRLNVSLISATETLANVKQISAGETLANVTQSSSTEASANLSDCRDSFDIAILKQLLIGCNRQEASSFRFDIGVPIWKLKIAILLTMGKKHEAMEAINRTEAWVLSDAEKCEVSALSEALTLLTGGKTLSEIECYIRKFYSPSMWDKLKEDWFCDSPFKKLTADIKPVKDESRIENQRHLYLELKKAFSENPIRQEDLSELFQ